MSGGLEYRWGGVVVTDMLGILWYSLDGLFCI